MRKLRKRRELHSLNPSFLRASSDRSDKVNVYIRGSIKVNYPALEYRCSCHDVSLSAPGGKAHPIYSASWHTIIEGYLQ